MRDLFVYHNLVSASVGGNRNMIGRVDAISQNKHSSR
jgi:hypothetical protein